MRRFGFTLSLCFSLFAVGCDTGSDDPSDDDTQVTDDPTDPTGNPGATDETDDTEAGATDTEPPFVVTYTQGKYKVDDLRILPADRGWDYDGDMRPDNNIAALLADMNSLGLGDFSITTVNLRIEDLLLEERAIVLMEGRYNGDTESLEVDVVQGERVGGGDIRALAEFYGPTGDANAQLVGVFTSEDTYEAGPTELTIPIQFYPDEPVLQLAAEQAYAVGRISESEIEGLLAGAFTKTVIMDNIVVPLLETFFEGDAGQVATFTGLASTLVDTRVDVSVGGEPAVSGAFSFHGAANDWLDPPP